MNGKRAEWITIAASLCIASLALASAWGGDRHRLDSMERRLTKVEEATSIDHDILIEIRTDVRAIKRQLAGD